MCPISGMVQFLIVVVTLLLLCHATLIRSLEIIFEPKNVTVHMYESVPIRYSLVGPNHSYNLQLFSENPKVAKFGDSGGIFLQDTTGTFNMTGNFLGNIQHKSKISA